MKTLPLAFGALNFHPLVFLREEALVPPDSGGQSSQVGPHEGLAPHHGRLGDEDQRPPAGQAQPPQWAHCGHTGTTLVWKYLLGRIVACCPAGRRQVLGTGSTFQQFNLAPSHLFQQIAWSRLGQFNARMSHTHTMFLVWNGHFSVEVKFFLNVQPDLLSNVVPVNEIILPSNWGPQSYFKLDDWWQQGLEDIWM